MHLSVLRLLTARPLQLLLLLFSSFLGVPEHVFEPLEDVKGEKEGEGDVLTGRVVDLEERDIKDPLEQGR